jgi:hypothetical protein
VLLLVDVVAASNSTSSCKDGTGDGAAVPLGGSGLNIVGCLKAIPQHQVQQMQEQEQDVCSSW